MGPMKGSYLLYQQRPGPHYALVRVLLEPRTQRSAVVSPNAFSWLREAYGDRANEGPGLDAYKHEAVSGAIYALDQNATGGEVTVTEIQYLTADTAD